MKSISKTITLICIIGSVSLFFGCDNKKSEKVMEIPTQENVYEHLMSFHEKYGAKREDICYSTFKCNPEQISEKVVIAPDFSSEIFKPYTDEIIDISSSSRGFKVTNIKKGETTITLINTGVGAP